MNLSERIAEALGWSLQDVHSFSLPTMREMVRQVNPSLAHEITQTIRRSSEYVAVAHARRSR